jgi:hypothetical protein
LGLTLGGGLQVDGVANGEIVWLDASTCEPVPGTGFQIIVVTITRFDAGGGVDQTSLDEGSSLLLLRAQVIISRTQGQARFRS